MIESARLASQVQDDDFHEIQLNGKQLVFAFMALTVVSVVIFLCGVLVGRGVRVDRGMPDPIAERPAAEPVPPMTAVERPPTVMAGQDPTKAVQPPAPADVAPPALKEAIKEVPSQSAAARSKPSVSPGTATTPTTPAASPPVASRRPAESPRVESPEAESQTRVAGTSFKSSEPVARPAGATGPAGNDAAVPVSTRATLPAADDSKGWVIQVAATKTRDEADTIAKRLNAKGYSAFVLSNSASVFRVRVGGYKSKRDADDVATRLRKEERINPWVTH